MIGINPYFYNTQLKTTDSKHLNTKNTVMQGKNNLPAPKAKFLASKYDIHFGSSPNDVDLDNFSTQFENKIKNMIFPAADSLNSAIIDSGDIEQISKIFENDKIGNIYYSGISLNSCLKYLLRKKQIKTNGPNTAFMIDNLSIDFLKNNDNGDFIKHLNSGKLKLYCFTPSNKEAQNLIKQFKDATGIETDITVIKKQINTKQTNYPDAKKIKIILQKWAQSKFPDNNQMQKKLLNIACKYLYENFTAFSYSTLCEKLKEQHNLIKQHVESENLNTDDIVYIIPQHGKSYDIINYLYAIENNIPQNKFMSFEDAEKTCPDNKIYVILDDIRASNNTLNSNILGFTKLHTKNTKLILSPIISTDTASFFAQYYIQDSKNYYGADIEYLPVTYSHDVGLVNKDAKYYTDQELEELERAKTNCLNAHKNLTREELDFFIKNAKGGFNEGYALITFPYMIPDNSCELNALIGSYFLNNDNSEANKGVSYYDCSYGRITPEEYTTLKQLIDN